MFAKFAKFRGAEEKWKDDLKKVWDTVFTFGVDLYGDYPWPKANAGAEEPESLEHQADDPENAGKAVTENNDETNDEQ